MCICQTYELKLLKAEPANSGQGNEGNEMYGILELTNADWWVV